MILERYLEYLNELDMEKIKSGFVTGNIHSGIKASLQFSFLYTPAAIMAWRTANFAFSSAVRKCGGVLASRKPGFKVCVSKEKIKALQTKIQLANSGMSQCSKSKNPEICQQKAKLEIEKCKNRIEIEKNKIQEILGEQVFSKAVKGAAGLAKNVSGLGISIAAGLAMDKATRLAFRSAQAVFSGASRKCGVYKKEGPERNLCISKIKFSSLNNQLSLLKRWLPLCSKNRDPEICKQKLETKIQKTIRNIEIQKNNIIAYQNEWKTQQREEEFKSNLKSEKRAMKQK